MPTVETDIGEKLRDLRLRKGRSVRALAQELGMSVSYLTAIESGKNSVTVGKLKNILEALGSNFGAFFAAEAEPTRKIVYRRRDQTDIAGGMKGVKMWEIAAGRPGRAMQMLWEQYEPGAGADVPYRYEAEDTGFVIQGELEFTVEDRTWILGPGDGFYYDARRPHRMRNVGKKKLELISCCTPPNF